ncbi:unnamed protein product [Periconia digitata]|uniref:Uncharacterized protein n=1 Tax=Periconia digitata TaxID=1303443 RepID=A0A9W4XCX7_9PLEO|nr:unnamed protein product [Periconia digitata]
MITCYVLERRTTINLKALAVVYLFIHLFVLFSRDENLLCGIIKSMVGDD